MKSKTLLKTAHSIIAVISLTVFLFTPFFIFGGKIECTGIDLLERMEGIESFWLLLYIVIPVMAVISNFTGSKPFHIVISCSMFVPLWMSFIIESDLSVELSTGGIIYCILSVSMIILAFINSNVQNDGTLPSPEQSGSTEEDMLAAGKSKAREMPLEKLNEIVNDPAMYNPILVGACRRELEIRNNAGALISRAKELSDEKLNEILANQEQYNDEMIYACQLEFDDRENQKRILAQKAEEERRKAEEEQRLIAEQQAREEKARETEIRAARWKKYRPLVFTGLILIVLAAAVIFFKSGYYNSARGDRFFRMSDYDKALAAYSKVRPSSKYYSESEYNRFKIEFNVRKDTAEAAVALKNAFDGTLWTCPDANIRYASYRLSGELAPYIKQDSIYAAQIFAGSPSRADRIKSGEIYFMREQYSKAYKVLKDNVWIDSDSSCDKNASGYLGIIYMYGLGAADQNLTMASHYLEEADSKAMFLMYKGICTLSNREDRNYNNIEYVQEADKCFAAASANEPDNRLYKLLNSITSGVTEAYRENQYYTGKNPYWDYYSYEKDGISVSFEGCTYHSMGGQKPTGWGFFSQKSNIKIGQFKTTGNNVIISGLGLQVFSDGSAWVGKIKDSVLQPGGYEIKSNGTIELVVN